jgi:hypothetical protein
MTKHTFTGRMALTANERKIAQVERDRIETEQQAINQTPDHLLFREKLEELRIIAVRINAAQTEDLGNFRVTFPGINVPLVERA